jgi:hypothetical protein
MTQDPPLFILLLSLLADLCIELGDLVAKINMLET